MKKHISKELAKWLHEQGCEVESEEQWMMMKVWSAKKQDFIDEWKLVVIPKCTVSELTIYPAYTYYQILAEPDKFFGGLDRQHLDLKANGDVIITMSNYDISVMILRQLQLKNYKEAEKVIRDNFKK